jgi:CRP/FNR family transcriptional regulator, cyclic AMP receptor protein
MHSPHSQDQRVTTIGSLPLFRTCTMKQLRNIRRLSAECDIAPGRLLCREGGRRPQFAVIIHGEVTVSVNGATITTLANGEFVGEIALLQAVPQTATVTATSETRVLVFGQQEFESLLIAAPEVAGDLALTAVRRLASSE